MRQLLLAVAYWTGQVIFALFLICLFAILNLPQYLS